MLDRYKTDPSNRTPALPVILAPQPQRDSFKVTTGSRELELQAPMKISKKKELP